MTFLFCNPLLLINKNENISLAFIVRHLISIGTSELILFLNVSDLKHDMMVFSLGFFSIINLDSSIISRNSVSLNGTFKILMTSASFTRSEEHTSELQSRGHIV